MVYPTCVDNTLLTLFIVFICSFRIAYCCSPTVTNIFGFYFVCTAVRFRRRPLTICWPSAGWLQAGAPDSQRHEATVRHQRFHEICDPTVWQTNKLLPCKLDNRSLVLMTRLLELSQAPCPSCRYPVSLGSWQWQSYRPPAPCLQWPPCLLGGWDHGPFTEHVTLPTVAGSDTVWENSSLR